MGWVKQARISRIIELLMQLLFLKNSQLIEINLFLGKT